MDAGPRFRYTGPMGRMPEPEEQDRVVVVGAGMVGVASALTLAREGRAVTLIDRSGPAEGASFGNGGVLAASSVVPVTVPGLPRKAPAMLLDPDAPLFLRWTYLPRLLPWLARYLAHCTPARAERIARGLLPLIGDSVQAHQALAEGTPAARWLRPSDYVFVYRDRARFSADAFGWRLRDALGIEWHELEGAAFRDYDPVFGPEHDFAAVLPGHGLVIDPGRYVRDLAAHFEALGGRFLRAEARDFRFADGRLQGVVLNGGETLACTRAVVAAGAWSAALAARLGLAVPLESERGYHLELDAPTRAPRAPSMIAEAKMVISPMEGRLRLAGIVEFGGLAAPPSPAPPRILERRAHETLPGLSYSASRHWMGHRPATSDSLPVIGAAPGRPDVFLAFGHHHVGLTAGARTGRLIADLVSGRRPNLDISPYAPERFASRR